MELVEKTQTGGKECKACLEWKTYSDFRIAKRHADGHEGKCKVCRDADDRNNLYLRKYDITTEQYNEMFAQQEGKCGICGKHQALFKKRLAVDHDHSLPKGHPDRVRGLLCDHCNMGLGKLGDNTQGLEQALRYLNGDTRRNSDRR